MKMRAWIRERPWIWIVALFVFFVVLNLIFALIAFNNTPEHLPH